MHGRFISIVLQEDMALVSDLIDTQCMEWIVDLIEKLSMNEICSAFLQSLRMN